MTVEQAVTNQWRRYQRAWFVSTPTVAYRFGALCALSSVAAEADLPDLSEAIHSAAQEILQEVTP